MNPDFFILRCQSLITNVVSFPLRLNFQYRRTKTFLRNRVGETLGQELKKKISRPEKKKLPNRDQCELLFRPSIAETCMVTDKRFAFIPIRKKIGSFVNFWKRELNAFLKFFSGVSPY